MRTRKLGRWLLGGALVAAVVVPVAQTDQVGTDTWEWTAGVAETSVFETGDDVAEPNGREEGTWEWT